MEVLSVRKLGLVLLIVLSLLAGFALADDGTPNMSGTACNMSGEELTVYRSADGASQRLGTISANGYATVEQVRRLADNSLWAQVKVDGDPGCSGWVRAEGLYLTDYMVVVNPAVGDRLNLRSEPSADAVSLGKFYNGAAVRLMDEPIGDWVKVRIGGLDGYMMRAYLEPFSIAKAVSLYEDMPQRVTVTAPCVGKESPNAAASNVSSYQAGDSVSLLAVRADGTALVKYYGTGFLEMSWVKSALLDPMPVFSANDSSQAANANLMIVVNPDPTDRLNLREEPDATSHTFGKYYTGTVVNVDTEISIEGWVYVNIGPEYGYMNKEYLIPYTSADAARYAAALPSVTVSNKGGTGVNLRSSPDSGRSVIRLAKNGSTFPVLGITANGFLCLKDGEQIVYAQSSMLSPAITFEK